MTCVMRVKQNIYTVKQLCLSPVAAAAAAAADSSRDSWRQPRYNFILLLSTNTDNQNLKYII